jgi:hypothetical protein
MFQAIFSGIFLEYIGLFIRWIILYIVNSLMRKEQKSFNTIKNKYRKIDADSVAYSFGNKIIGIAFLLAIVLTILQIEGPFRD